MTRNRDRYDAANRPRLVMPPDRLDRLTHTVLAGLRRGVLPSAYYSSGLAAFFTLLTLGVWPLWVMARSLDRYGTWEQQMLWHAAEWLRLHTARRDADDLKRYAEDIPRMLPPAWPGRLLLAGAIVFGVVALGLAGVSFVGAWRVLTTLPFAPDALGHARALGVAVGAYTVLVTAAGFHHLWRVNRRVLALRGFADRFNLLADDMRLLRLGPVAFVSGMRPMWLLLGVVLTAFGAFFALPVMLAGAGHRHYMTRRSTTLRGELADRVEAMLGAQGHPPERLPPTHGQHCQNEACGTRLAAGASFCQRCGTAVRAWA
ncbi:MAG: zinc ribbon domain-containing protein [Phycisphaerae bacterium]